MTSEDRDTDKADIFPRGSRPRVPADGLRHTYREGGRTVETTSTDPSVEQR